MGLAAGINFSMRSVIVTDRRYFAANFEHQVEADELLQMFGRAGRRGLDEVGYALYTNDLPRLSDARPRQLKRAAQVDWPSLISVMHAAAERSDKSEAGGQNGAHGMRAIEGEVTRVGANEHGQRMSFKSEVGTETSDLTRTKSDVRGRSSEKNPFAAAVEVTRSLFSVQQVPLGVEHSLETGPRPCGFWVTDERARFVRRSVTEMVTSHGRWE